MCGLALAKGSQHKTCFLWLDAHGNQYEYVLIPLKLFYFIQRKAMYNAMAKLHAADNFDADLIYVSTQEK